MSDVPEIQFTAVGFVAPSSEAVLAGVQGDITASFGGALNYQLTTPQGQLASSMAAIINYANATFVYYSQQTDPAYASGRFQDAIGRLYFLERDGAEPTALQIICTGADGVVIPEGAQIVDVSGNIYNCTQAGTISDGSVTLPFSAAVPGPTAVPSANDVSIYQAIPEWDSVSVASGVVGRNTETRAEFEARREDSVAGNSFGAIGSVIGAVAKVPGVLDYYGYNNNTSGNVVVGGVTIAAYAIYVCVAGGDPDDIAAAILSKKGAGAPMVGDTEVTAYDDNPLYASPIPYTIKYQTAAPLQTLFKVTLVSGPTVPASAEQQVQAALIAAFSGSSLEASFVGSISGTILTVTELISGALSVGQTLSDLTGNMLANTKIVSLGTGTGGAGTYTVDLNQNVLSENMTGAAPIQNLPRARIGSILYAIQYIPAIAALGPWALVADIKIGSKNTPEAEFTARISGTTMTVETVGSGSLEVGDYVTDDAALVANGTIIVSQTSGTPNGAGVYEVNQPQTVGGATFTGSGSGTDLTASAVTGTIAVGDTVIGTGIGAGVTILSQTSGTPGGAGVYVTSASTTASGTITTLKSMQCSTPDQTVLTVQADQVPQLLPVNIEVVTT